MPSQKRVRHEVIDLTCNEVVVTPPLRKHSRISKSISAAQLEILFGWVGKMHVEFSEFLLPHFTIFVRQLVDLVLAIDYASWSLHTLQGLGCACMEIVSAVGTPDRAFGIGRLTDACDGTYTHEEMREFISTVVKTLVTHIAPESGNMHAITVDHIDEKENAGNQVHLVTVNGATWVRKRLPIWIMGGLMLSSHFVSTLLARVRVPRHMNIVYPGATGMRGSAKSAEVFFPVLQTFREAVRHPTSTQVQRHAHALVRAVVSCHSSGCAHRDIKAENVMFEKTSGRLQLIDFDSSITIAHGATWPLLTEWPVCTLTTAAPLPVSGQYCPRRLDTYSVGAVVFAMANDGDHPGNLWEEEDMKKFHAAGGLPMQSQELFTPRIRILLGPHGVDFVQDCMVLCEEDRPFLSYLLANHPYLKNVL